MGLTNDTKCAIILSQGRRNKNMGAKQRSPSKVESTKNRKTKEYFISNMKVGNVVAFVIHTREGNKMLSGRVISISKDIVTVNTKNGSIFYPSKSDVVWVKTGSFWPVGIYNALRYER